jgi:hypothetical protein
MLYIRLHLNITVLAQTRWGTAGNLQTKQCHGISDSLDQKNAFTLFTKRATSSWIDTILTLLSFCTIPSPSAWSSPTIYDRSVFRIQTFDAGVRLALGVVPLHCRGFTVTLRHTRVGRTPLDKWSARRRDLCLTTHSTHKRQTSMPPPGFETTIPASERSQTHALDRAATGISLAHLYIL